MLGLAEVYACQDKHTELKSLLTELVDYPSVEVLLQAQLYFELGQVNGLTRLASLNAEPVMEDTILGDSGRTDWRHDRSRATLFHGV